MSVPSKDNNNEFGYLNIKNPDGSNKLYNLQPGSYTLGNSVDATIRLHQNDIKRIFGTITVNDDTTVNLIIWCSNTIFPVKVNGKFKKKYQTVLLNNNDVIEVAQIKIVYVNLVNSGTAKNAGLEDKRNRLFITSPRPKNMYETAKTPNKIRKSHTPFASSRLYGKKKDATATENQLKENESDLSIAVRKTPRNIIAPRKYADSSITVTPKYVSKSSITPKSALEVGFDNRNDNNNPKDIVNSSSKMHNEDFGELVIRNSDSKPVVVSQSSLVPSRRSQKRNSESDNSVLESTDTSSIIFENVSRRRRFEKSLESKDFLPTEDEVNISGVNKLSNDVDVPSTSGYVDKSLKEWPFVRNISKESICLNQSSDSSSNSSLNLTARSWENESILSDTEEIPSNDLITERRMFTDKSFKDGERNKSKRNSTLNVSIDKNSTRTPRRSLRKIVASTPNSPFNNLSGVKRLLKTPKETNHLTDARVLKRRMSTNDFRFAESAKTDLKHLLTSPDETNDLKTARVAKRRMSTPIIDVGCAEGLKGILKTPKRPRESSNSFTDATAVKNLIISPKSPQNILHLKKSLNTPPIVNFSKSDSSNVEGVTEIVKTPKKIKKPKNDLSDARGVKKFKGAPKIQASPKNDLTSVEGVKRLMKTPKVQRSPKNDLTNVKGVKRVMNTPKVQRSPKNDLTNVKGVKRVMKTPKVQRSPKNDLTNVKGVKRLMKTPKRLESPKNDLSDVAGVRRLMSTPKPSEVPLNDLTNFKPFKHLFKKSPKNDLENIRSLKTVFQTPSGSKNDLTDVRGVKKLMRTPKESKNDLSDVRGVKKLLSTPKLPASPKNSLEDVPNLSAMFRQTKARKLSKDNLVDRSYSQLLDKSLNSAVGDIKKRYGKSPKNDYTNVIGVKRLFAEEEAAFRRASTVLDVKNIFESPSSSQAFDKLLHKKPPRTYAAKRQTSSPRERLELEVDCESEESPVVPDSVKNWVEEQCNYAGDGNISSNYSSPAPRKRAARINRKEKVTNKNFLGERKNNETTDSTKTNESLERVTRTTRKRKVAAQVIEKEEQNDISKTENNSIEDDVCAVLERIDKTAERDTRSRRTPKRYGHDDDETNSGVSRRNLRERKKVNYSEIGNTTPTRKTRNQIKKETEEINTTNKEDTISASISSDITEDVKLTSKRSRNLKKRVENIDPQIETDKETETATTTTTTTTRQLRRVKKVAYSTRESVEENENPAIDKEIDVNKNQVKKGKTQSTKNLKTNNEENVCDKENDEVTRPKRGRRKKNETNKSDVTDTKHSSEIITRSKKQKNDYVDKAFENSAPVYRSTRKRR